MIPIATSTRRFWPPERVPIAGLALLGQADQLDRLLDRARRVVEGGEERDRLAHGQQRVELALLQDQADAVAPLARRLAGSTPSTATSPPLRSR